MNSYAIKEFIRKNYKVFIVFFIVILAVTSYLLLTNINFEDFGYKWWFDGLNQREQQEYLEGYKSGFSDGSISHRNVISVEIENDNGFANLDNSRLTLTLSLETKNLKSTYTFIYGDTLCSKIVKGDKNLLTIDKRYFKEYQYLQLTQETLDELGITEKVMKENKYHYWYFDR